MNINLIYDAATVNATTLGSAANLAAFKSQIAAAAQLYETTFLDPVTLNITVKYAKVGLGQSETTIVPESMATVKDALKKDATSLDDIKTVNSLGTSGTVYVLHAQAKALGLITGNDSSSDGTITFDNTPGLIDFTHSSAMSASSYDLFGVAAHEISEIMGRLIPHNPATPTIFSQFDTASHFVIGSETLLEFNTDGDPNQDVGDWDSSVAANDAFRAVANPDVVSAVSATDLRAMDVIGWDHRALDLVLAIDTTGSMGPYIANAKANAIQIANAAFGTDASPIDARIAVVGFKDAAGPSGPGENTAVLQFTDQDTYAARKQAVADAINPLIATGGGDIPEGDNSAILFALQGALGDWRRAAQDHKIVLFTDAPIKDTALADQVAAAAKKLNTTITYEAVTSSAGLTTGSFSFSAPADSIPVIDPATGEASSAAADATDGPGDIDLTTVIPGGPPPTISFSAQVYVVQVGSDSSATAGLQNLANSTDGGYFTANAADLSTIIQNIIALPPANQLTISGAAANQATTDAASVAPFASCLVANLLGGATGSVTITPSSTANGTFSDLGGGSVDAITGAYTISGSVATINAALAELIFTPTVHEVAPGATVTTSFSIAYTDTGGASATDNTTSVMATAAAVPGFAAFDVSTASPLPSAVTNYHGPVSNLASQYINLTSDSINVTASNGGWFIHSGSGTDAIAVGSGTNVIDGGTGSNFVTSGSGFDTVFLDARNATSDIWSTIVNFHASDSATVWGVTAAGFRLNWTNGEGARGFTGLTGHLTAAGKPNTSLTLVGYTTADLTNGKLALSYGTDAASGSSYLYVHATG